ncbi:MAG: sensor histidine kinase [Chlorobiaceae bacterium]|nr:sensor histidine kinase [Chlorobiaceae bacterium]
MKPALHIHQVSFFKLHYSVALLLLSAMFITGSLKSAAAAPIPLGSSPSYELAGHMERFDDPSGKMTLKEILDPENRAVFNRLDGYLNEGYSHKAVWLRFTLLRTSRFPPESWLRLDSPYLDHIAVFIQTGSDPGKASSYRRVLLGDHVPVASRPVLNPDFMVPLSLTPAMPVTVYVRISSISSLTFTATVHTPPDMASYTYANIMLQGGYLTITLVIVLLNLIFFLRIWDRLFLYFSLYALAVFTNYLSISGILSLILPGSAHLLSDYLADIGKGGGILLFSIFLLRLFAADVTLFSRAFLITLAVVGALTTLADPAGFYIEMAPITSIWVLLSFFVVSWLSVKAIRNHRPAGSIFFVAFSISNLGYFLHFLKLLGWVPIDWWNINNIQIASLINMVLMTIALAERLRQTEIRAREALLESERSVVEVQSEKLATERQKRFLAMVSHEYRTPLAIIRSTLDLMQLDNAGRSSSDAADLDKMQRAVSRLVDVMEVSLEKSRLSDSQEIDGARTIPLAQLIDAEFDEIRIFWPGRPFVTTASIGSEVVRAEVHYLKTAIFNILDNAQKYSPPGTPIDVDCRIDGGEAIVTVRNQGIAPFGEDAERLFDKYRRGGNSSNTSGSGLGLWLARQIVERHHGRIFLEALDDHVVVTLRLPLAEINAEVS